MGVQLPHVLSLGHRVGPCKLQEQMHEIEDEWRTVAPEIARKVGL